MNTIEINTLKLIFRELIKKLEKEGVNEIPIDYDLYKLIPSDKWSIYESNTEDHIVIGSLLDDLESIQKILNIKERICTYVDFDRVASLLHYISEKLNPAK